MEKIKHEMYITFYSVSMPFAILVFSHFFLFKFRMNYINNCLYALFHLSKAAFPFSHIIRKYSYRFAIKTMVVLILIPKEILA